jgi:hypothetical protein
MYFGDVGLYDFAMTLCILVMWGLVVDKYLVLVIRSLHSFIPV